MAQAIGLVTHQGRNRWRWIIQFRTLTKGSEEQLQGSEAASLAKLGLEVQEGLAQVEPQRCSRWVHRWNKGGGRTEHGICEAWLVGGGGGDIGDETGLCKAEASDLPLSAGRRFGPGEQ